MAKVRSPNYPNTTLGGALAMARKAFDKDHRNKMSQGALGRHLGHESLSGPALGKIGALRAFGLIEGTGDELRITDDAVTAMMAPTTSGERVQALERLALRPSLFREIYADYPETLPSEDNLRFWLVKRQFTSDAATKAAKAYLGTMRLVTEAKGGYNLPAGEGEEIESTAPQNVEQAKPPASPQPPPFPAGVGHPAPGDYMLMMYDNRIRIAADVDVAGAKALVAKLKKRIELLEEEIGGGHSD